MVEDTLSTTTMDRDHSAMLMQAIAEKGDKAAFAQLFAFYAPRVKGFLMRLGSSDATADELAQEVMLAVWRKAHTFDPNQASVSTWVYRIARNRRIDLARRENRQREELEREANDQDMSADPEETPDEPLMAREREARVREALAQLPVEQADLVRRAFFGDQTHRDIADETGLPLGTVKSRLRLAFGRLRKALDEEI
jgi:RNA polymerase sigma-70 factor (ECF subfamily)